ncbi:4-(cytidine 5'-diphospho)-2-C-methyl-D-erythritol kinase [Roseateles sp.]|uniref:4-(cytidine 5'-diphospho)-2-C-methyl-D-erythritol kinase n=1 Tax=Roseateles sp. TaxID=1971397 RepID=UPI00286BFF9F|nr:4-(cytidine 5'-diphospho)-2-C-methyl-D-erythritol kinase [Roseateles sp.]
MQAIYDVPAPAKLNLFLHVVGKRPDGYHLLQSIFTLIDWADTLHFERRSDGQLLRHDQGHSLPADDLCLRAARLLQQQSGCAWGVDIQVEKRLPAGAGMGGGSSDAASTLLALNRLWGLNWPLSKLLSLGLRLGADVPFFLGGSHAFVEGIGEILHAIELPPLTFAVLKPSQSISTQEIFASPHLARSKKLVIVAGFPANNSSAEIQGEELIGLDNKRIANILGGFGRNDLQKPAEVNCAGVIQALQILESEFGNSRMTGSGSAVFARVATPANQQEINLLNQMLLTKLQGLPADWSGRICRSLDRHPLQGWAG